MTSLQEHGLGGPEEKYRSPFAEFADTSLPTWYAEFFLGCQHLSFTFHV
jgi:hypothetical protein